MQFIYQHTDGSEALSGSEQLPEDFDVETAVDELLGMEAANLIESLDQDYSETELAAIDVYLEETYDGLEAEHAHLQDEIQSELQFREEGDKESHETQLELQERARKTLPNVESFQKGLTRYLINSDAGPDDPGKILEYETRQLMKAVKGDPEFQKELMYLYLESDSLAGYVLLEFLLSEGVSVVDDPFFKDVDNAVGSGFALRSLAVQNIQDPEYLKKHIWRLREGMYMTDSLVPSLSKLGPENADFVRRLIADPITSEYLKEDARKILNSWQS
ncbi:hypothetical protein HN748_03900 [Candidatus Peregrinibacteria bacterium]|jgi:hypothetical protein|nr:hypothetical protein [Candidatus Peregrinibacteria bacterium]MBT7483891.1 hypothetical protein [Candidatus Peregrinibacteria bacterium]MBT7703353.1 hypothetical protein [Candidatus Peregrinibacteria bacterium]